MRNMRPDDVVLFVFDTLGPELTLDEICRYSETYFRFHGTTILAVERLLELGHVKMAGRNDKHGYPYFHKTMENSNNERRPENYARTEPATNRRSQGPARRKAPAKD